MPPGKRRYIDPLADDAPVVRRRGRYIDPLADDGQESTGEEPNNLERAIGEFIQDKPTLQSVLGALGAPGSAVSNLLQGEGGKAVENITDLGRAISPFHEQTFEDRSSFKDVLTKMGMGQGGEVDLPLIGKVTGKGALGLVGDIATDPLRFTGLARLTGKGAALTKQGKLTPTRIPTPDELAAGVKPMSNLGAQAAAGERALIGARVPFTSEFIPLVRGQRVLDLIGKGRDKIRTDSFLGRRFSTIGGIEEIGTTVRGAGLAGRATVQGPLENAYWSVRRMVEKEIKAAGGDFDKWKSELVEIAEGRKVRGDIVDQLDPATVRQAEARIKQVSQQFNKRLGELDRVSPEERARALAFIQDNPHLLDDPNGVYTALMATRVNRVMDDALAADNVSGIDIKMLDDPELNYWIRLVKPEARKALTEHGLATEFMDHTRRVLAHSTKARKEAWRGKTRGEINSWWRSKGFKDDLFETDPDILVDARLGKTGQYAEISESVLKTFEVFGREANDALREAGWVPSDVAAKGAGLPLLELGDQSGKMIPQSVAKELQNVIARTHDIAAPSKLLEIVDGSMSAFKSAVTSVFPQFHARNFISNVWANFLGGVDNPVHYGTAARILKDWRKVVREGGDGAKWTVGGRTVRTRQLVEEMNNHRAFGFGALSEAELGRFTVRRAGENRALAGVRYPFRKGRQFGELVENHSKIAHYVAKLEDGFTPAEAASSVKKYLFDYSSLTDFEKNVMKRVVPFYCVPEDCEILTRRGWKRLDGLHTGADEVVTYDHAEGTTRWEMLNEVAVFPYDGELMTLSDSRNGSFAFTPSHGWPVIDQAGNRKLVKGYELRSNHRIPHIADRHVFQESAISEREAAIIGWVLTDGTIRARGRHREYIIYQSVNKFANELRELLGNDANEWISDRSDSPRSNADVVHFTLRGDLRRRIAELLPDKTYGPLIATELDERGARVMYDAMYKADGVTSDNRNQDFFASINQDVFDTFQILAMLTGRVVQQTPRGGYVRHAHKLMKVAGKIGTERYAGRVWCPELNGKCWYMRRNGKIILTQNTFFRKNIPLQLESMLTKPGRVAVAAHVQRALQARTDDKSPLDTSFVPEWMRRRIFGIKEGKGDDLATISGVGIGLEELAVFDRPFQELLAMIRPEIKGALQAGTDRDLFRDLPLGQSDMAPSSFRHLEHIPGGKAFLDWMDFRAVDENKGRYRANPKVLNFMMSLPLVGSTSRALNVGSNLDKATAPGADPGDLGETMVRLMTGLREENLGPVEQSRRNMFNMLRLRQEFLRKKVLEGSAREIPIFIPRKELGVDDPRSKQVREASAEIRKILKALKGLQDDTESTLRGGGR